MKYEELFESVMDYKDAELNVVLEGANIEVSKKVNEVRFKYKDLMKKIKKCKADKNYKEAIELANECKELLDETRDFVNEELGNDVSTTVFGMIYGGFMNSMEMLIGAFIGFGVGEVFVAAKNIIREIHGIAEQWKDNDKDLSLSMLNTRKNKLLSIISDMQGMIKKLIDELENLEKEANKEEKEEKDDKEVKESASSDEVKLAIYESCHAGDITEEERDELLAIM